MRGEGVEDFEDFSNKHAEMKFTEHQILHTKWVDDEKQRRLEQRKAAVKVSKPQRQIETSQFGHYD